MRLEVCDVSGRAPPRITFVVPASVTNLRSRYVSDHTQLVPLVSKFCLAYCFCDSCGKREDVRGSKKNMKSIRFHKKLKRGVNNNLKFEIY